MRRTTLDPRLPNQLIKDVDGYYKALLFQLSVFATGFNLDARLAVPKPLPDASQRLPNPLAEASSVQVYDEYDNYAELLKLCTEHDRSILSIVLVEQPLSAEGWKVINVDFVTEVIKQDYALALLQTTAEEARYIVSATVGRLNIYEIESWMADVNRQLTYSDMKATEAVKQAYSALHIRAKRISQLTIHEQPVLALEHWKQHFATVESELTTKKCVAMIVSGAEERFGDALSYHLQLPRVTILPADIFSKYVGDGEKILNNLASVEIKNHLHKGAIIFRDADGWFFAEDLRKPLKDFMFTLYDFVETEANARVLVIVMTRDPPAQSVSRRIQ